MSGAKEEKLVQVFSGNLWQAELVKGLLDANAVPCVIIDESIGAGTSPYSSTAGDVLVAVDEEHEATALKVIEENSIPEK